MNTSLDAAVKEAYALAPASVAHIHTIELRHESIATGLFLVQGFRHLELGLETGEMQVFTAVPFAFKLPGSSEAGLQELSLTIDNVGNRPTDFLELAMNFPSPVEVHYRPYISTDLTYPKMDPPLRLVLTEVSVSDTQVAGRATPADFLNRNFISENYTRTIFPSLGSL